MASGEPKPPFPRSTGEGHIAAHAFSGPFAQVPRRELEIGVLARSTKLVELYQAVIWLASSAAAAQYGDGPVGGQLPQGRYRGVHRRAGFGERRGGPR